MQAGNAHVCACEQSGISKKTIEVVTVISPAKENWDNQMFLGRREFFVYLYV